MRVMCCDSGQPFSLWLVDTLKHIITRIRTHSYQMYSTVLFMLLWKKRVTWPNRKITTAYSQFLWLVCLYLIRGVGLQPGLQPFSVKDNVSQVTVDLFGSGPRQRIHSI